MFSDIGLSADLNDGKTYCPPPVSGFIILRTSIAWIERGTICSCRIFIFLAVNGFWRISANYYGHLKVDLSIFFGLLRLSLDFQGLAAGGGSRIRTHGPFQSCGFQDRRLRPLGHPSQRGILKRYVFIASGASDVKGFWMKTNPAWPITQNVSAQ